MITVVIGKIIHGVFVLGRSYYSGSGWYNDDGSFYIWSCCNQSVLMLPYAPDSTVYRQAISQLTEPNMEVVVQHCSTSHLSRNDSNSCSPKP